MTSTVKPEDVAYTAGFFDGEGSVMVLEANSNLPYVRITISQNDVEPLNWVRERFGGTIRHVRGNNNALMIGKAKEVIFFIETILPYVLRRKTMLTIALAIAKMSVDEDKSMKNVLIRYELKKMFDELKPK